MRAYGEGGIHRMLDIATGVGTMAELFLAQLPSGWRFPHVVCIDKSEEALDLAREHLGLPPEAMTLVHAEAETLSLEPACADIAVWGNGIHYLSAENQESALARIKEALRPHGWLFFNTTFYEGARPPDTMPFYRAQIVEAVRFLRKRGVERTSVEGRPEASRYLSVDHYRALTERVGFTVIETRESVARTSLSFWEAICSYYQYSAGALHGYSPHEAALALQEAVKSIFGVHAQPDAEGGISIPRRWLAVAARV
jgi:ubiquinone/menaquinone biosynthesis C-methylase UbiE